ncbi:GDP-L-fucose synthase family protein [Dethiosulfovibrio salsuginis]|uniref:GDP-L-fucose synthase n=1 Tax=Dethiosulfovibrio salsuginis TaxID=561720 RepID=A0A1X7JPE0_9BACT|nr:GDP-L-fucose synthase [Dethiosulfovibrio salsuginis]SMG30109.1 GDP-L-fucose synthase [Dethiosulfovibrio salsuginis]
MKKIYVAGHNGLVGSAIVKSFKKNGYENILVKSHEELDLTDQCDVSRFFEKEEPEWVILAAAKVGGIMANKSCPAEFMYHNLAIEVNVIHQAWLSGVKKLLFLGSSCIYPRMAPQPIKEEYLLTGPLETTNEAYALAKISGLKMCEYYNRQYGADFISVMPTNLYGPGDNFDLESSHVLPAMIRKFDDAKREGKPTVTLWGTGAPRREFLHVDDMASACLHVMENYKDPEFVNIGVGKDISIKELAEMVKEIVGFGGDIEWDLSKPDGTPRKLLDIGKLAASGWKPSISLKDGIVDTYRWYAENRSC